MKRVLIFVLAVLLAFSFSSCTGGDKKNSKTIAVVAKGESHAFWQSVKRGAQDAAKEHGYTVTFRGPASESAKDLPSQQEMVQTALSNNVKGLVIATIGEGFTDMLSRAYDMGIPVISFDSGIWQRDLEALDKQGKNPILASVATSDRMAASLAAENFFEAVRDDIIDSDEYILGIIQHDQTRTGSDRAGGFEDRFIVMCEADPDTKGKCRVIKEIKPGDADNAYKSALEALYEKGADGIFMSNEGVVKQVYDAINASGTKYDGIKFCGFDAGSKQIEWMTAHKGARLVGSVAQDSYRIGYDALTRCIDAAEGRNIDETADIGGVWWNKDNVDEMIKKGLVYEG